MSSDATQPFTPDSSVRSPNTPRTILVADDDPASLSIISRVLRSEFRTRVARDGATAVALACEAPHPDLILLDVEMPGAVDGYEACRQLKARPETADIPVMFLSSHSEVADIQLGLELGATDFVSKPVLPPILLARIRTHLRLHESRLLLQDQNHHLEAMVQHRTEALRESLDSLVRTQGLTVLALGALAETRDNETGNHIYRTQAYVRTIVGQLQATRKFAGQLEDETARLIWECAPLHDIGKVGIPDRILLKPGKLEFDEFEIMKTHTTLGRQALLRAQERADLNTPFIHTSLEIAYAHHEHWNGKGYPEGISANAIPLSARIMAVADVYDALVTPRVYKPPFSHEKAVAIITEERATHFDPDVTDAFLDMADQCHAIAEQYQDKVNES